MWTEDGKQSLSGRGRNPAAGRSGVGRCYGYSGGRAFQLREAGVQVSEFVLECELVAQPALCLR